MTGESAHPQSLKRGAHDAINSEQKGHEKKSKSPSWEQGGLVAKLNTDWQWQ